MPVIVTSARLFTCDFLSTDVDGAPGEIPFDRAELHSVPRVVYEFALPNYLQRVGEKDNIVPGTSIEIFVRRHILVIQSNYFSKFLQNQAFDFLPPPL